MLKKLKKLPKDMFNNELTLLEGNSIDCLDLLPNNEIFDLVVTSPPYNIGKEYEKVLPIGDYIDFQKTIIEKIVPKVKETGSICWQVGNYVNKKGGHITPLDILLHPIFDSLGLKLRNRIIWKFGHGFHAKKRFSGRYETVLWYTKGDNYTFNLDEVRIPSKYPGKTFYKGPNKGKYSSNPLGKNPEDVWDIPNVKASHIEKTSHPAQFPVGLIERLILGLTNKGDLIFDPFAGVASTGVAAGITKRRFLGVEIKKEYVKIGLQRLCDVKNGKAKFRPHNKPIYDHHKSPLSKKPDEKG